MSIAEVTGFCPNNIYFCAKIAGSRGKGRIAKRLGITHMIDDRYEALMSVHYAAENFPERGQLFHLSPSSKEEFPEERFIPVTTWLGVMAHINVANQSHTESRGDDSSPRDEWLADIDFRAEQSSLEVPAMPLLEKKVEPVTHRLKTAASWSPFPVAVTKMISKKR